MTSNWQGKMLIKLYQFCYWSFNAWNSICYIIYMMKKRHQFFFSFYQFFLKHLLRPVSENKYNGKSSDEGICSLVLKWRKGDLSIDLCGCLGGMVVRSSFVILKHFWYKAWTLCYWFNKDMTCDKIFLQLINHECTFMVKGGQCYWLLSANQTCLSYNSTLLYTLVFNLYCIQIKFEL